MNILLRGRICDIVRSVQSGQVETARNLVANTPGVDWIQMLSPSIHQALFTERVPGDCDQRPDSPTTPMYVPSTDH